MPAKTWPVKWAPGVILKLPSIRTSPLKRPAIRTFPGPSILPSIVRFAAMTDSPPSDDVLGVGRRGETASAGSVNLRSGKFRSGGGPVGQRPHRAPALEEAGRHAREPRRIHGEHVMTAYRVEIRKSTPFESLSR